MDGNIENMGFCPQLREICEKLELTIIQNLKEKETQFSPGSNIYKTK